MTIARNAHPVRRNGISKSRIPKTRKKNLSPSPLDGTIALIALANSFCRRQDHPLVTIAKTLAGRNSHIKVSYGIEAGLFVAMADIPSVVIGPGAIAQAHKPDEFMEVAELEQCADMIEKLIARCSEPNGLDKLARH